MRNFILGAMATAMGIALILDKEWGIGLFMCAIGFLFAITNRAWREL